MGFQEDFLKITKRLDLFESDMIEFQKSITAIPALSSQNCRNAEFRILNKLTPRTPPPKRG